MYVYMCVCELGSEIGAAVIIVENRVGNPSPNT